MDAGRRFGRPHVWLGATAMIGWVALLAPSCASGRRVDTRSSIDSNGPAVWRGEGGRGGVDVGATGGSSMRSRSSAAPALQQAPLEPYRDSIPRTLVTFEMIPLPGGTVEVPGPNGPRMVEVDPVWIGQTELTWDAYDVFALGLDKPGSETEADAIARPSPPYGAPDYGWGHQGYPVMSVTRDAAEAFCEWLSAKTGRTYRLPTEAEWLRAAELAMADAAASPERLDSIAWHEGNADGTTQAVAARSADALGLYDLFGNVAEWVGTDDGDRVLRGGSFRDPVAAMADSARAVQDYSWNERDPQLPKSRWWLSDAPFAGFRIVREP